jgi:DNA-binding NarL/FixJ family response regulator
MQLRILVVEDHEQFRRYLCSTIEQWAKFRVIEQASDGLEAVLKVEELQPDLILLDVGLPELNGIEAARRIRELLPDCKILFLSQESDAAIVQEALSLGSGYVVKVSAGRELLTAVEAVLQGDQFVSSDLAERDPSSRWLPDCRQTRKQFRKSGKLTV